MFYHIVWRDVTTIYRIMRTVHIWSYLHVWSLAPLAIQRGTYFFLVLPSLSQNNVTGGKCWHRGFPYCCHTFHYCFLTLCKSLNFVRYPLAIEHALLENLYLYMCFLLKSIWFGDFLAFITLKGTYIVAPWCGRPLWKIAPTSIEFANPITTMKNTSVDALD